jgi:CheY-like chemotaxis protein
MHRDIKIRIGKVISNGCVASLMTSIVVVLFASTAMAQNPFGDNPFAPMPSDEPMNVAPPASGTNPLDEDALAEPPNPVVRAIREANPVTPDELCWAVKALLDVRAYDEADRYLNKLVGQKLDDAELAALTRKYGNGLFFKIAGSAELKETNRELGRRALVAAQKAAQDPAVISAAINDLSGSFAERNAALVDLKAAGDAGLSAVVAALANPALADKHATIRAGIEALGESTIGPLLAALQTNDSQFRAQAMVVLGKLHAKKATPFLLFPAVADSVGQAEKRAAKYALIQIVGELPSRYDALTYLRLQSYNYLNGELPYTPDSQNRIQYWVWDDKAGLPQRVALPAEQVAVAVGKQLATELIELDPESALAKRLYLIAQLESAKRISGISQPLAAGSAELKLGGEFSTDELVDALHQAIEEEHLRAAVGLIEVLKVAGNDSLLYTSGQPHQVAALLRHPNRHVRFAATDAILTWDPKQPFPGSSEVISTLARLVYQDGFETGMVVTPHVARGRNIASLLQPLNFETRMATNGHDALKLAFRGGDFRFILISDTISEPTIGELLQQIRKDPRTASIPVGMMVREEKLPAMQRLAAQDGLTTAFLRPFDEQTMAFQIRRVLEPAELSYVAADVRMQRSCWAISQLDRLATDWKNYPFYDLLRAEDSLCRSLLVGGCRPQAIKALGELATRKAQKALVEYASGPVHPASERAAAVDAFANAIRQRGILLDSNEIKLQYDRYNQSRDLDRATQTILGSVLDAIEAPSQANDKTVANQEAAAG